MTTTLSEGARSRLQFHDIRLPQALCSVLERQYMTRFTPEVREGHLEYRAVTKAGGLPCRFRLVYEAATPNGNRYSLHMEMSWAHLPAEHHDHYRRSSESWFQLWTQDWAAAARQAPGGEDAALYPQRVAQALDAESHLADVASIQQEILTALKTGATFATAHKEGGTRIGHAQGRYFSWDYGESTAERTFTEDSAFLAYLRAFFDGDLSRDNAAVKMSEEDAWRLILRRLDTLK